MKIAKKTAAFLLVLFLGIQCMPLTALAADGTLSFSDPTAKAGETIEVTVKINTAEGPIGDGQVQVTYDPTYLESSPNNARFVYPSPRSISSEILNFFVSSFVCSSLPSLSAA